MTLIFTSLYFSRKALTDSTLLWRVFSIWDLTTSMLEMMPTTFFVFSSTTGRFLIP